MDGIGLDRFREIFSDRALLGIRRIGRAHDFAVAADGIFAFQHLDDNRSRGHKTAQIVKEGAFLVHIVKTLRLRPGQLEALLRDYAQSGLLKSCIDLSRQVATRGVRLED